MAVGLTPVAPRARWRSVSASAHSGSPGPCSMATVTDRPGRSARQRRSRSTAIRTGTRCVTLVNSPELTSRGRSAKFAPVAQPIQTTRPERTSGNASTQIRTRFPGATPSSRSSSR